MVGTLQALEAVKLLSGVGEPLSRRLLLVDALAARFHSVKLRARCGRGGFDPSFILQHLAGFSTLARMDSIGWLGQSQAEVGVHACSQVAGVRGLRVGAGRHRRLAALLRLRSLYGAGGRQRRAARAAAPAGPGAAADAGGAEGQVSRPLGEGYCGGMPWSPWLPVHASKLLSAAFEA